MSPYQRDTVKIILLWGTGIVALYLVLTLSACGGGGGSSRPKPIPSPVQAQWEIGPSTPDHGNYSIGLPPTTSGVIEISQTQEPHYITKRYGPLTYKHSIRLRYRVEADEGVRIYPKCCQELQPSVTLYFQKRDDDWSSDGGRWWATFASGTLEPGDHEISAPLDGNWTSVFTMSRASNGSEYAAAVHDADRVGFTFGGGDGYGHGVRATGPVKFVILEFTIE